MMIELNKSFADYIPSELISGGDCSYRQVYKAMDWEGTEVFLTVYDPEKLPKCLQGDTVKEFRITYNMTNEVFPQHVGTGAATYEGRSMHFMSTLFFDYKTLREVVSSKELEEKDALKIVYHLLIGLKELLYYTKGGGHYNICPDTILLSKTSEGTYTAHISGMDHASESCNGNPDFDTETLNHCFRAPESFLGRFSPASDVYSVGMLLAYMLQGIYPYDINESMAKDKILKVVRASRLKFDVADGLKSILTKATNKKASDRYKDVVELGEALMNYMGMEMPKRFSCFSGKKRNIFETEKKKGKKMEMDELVQSPETPGFDAKIGVKTGAGFKAVAGMEEVKKRLTRDFVEVVSHPELARAFGIMPSNLLFFGAPGTGKTFITERLAEETGMAYCAVKPSDIGSIWLHGSVSIIKDLFLKAEGMAKENKRGCILLIDEMEAVCSRRDTPKGNDHVNEEVAEWLTQLNNCVEKNVFVVGTTNCLERIDRAIIRKGRIDEVIYIGLPDSECRRQLFELELEKRPHEEGIDVVSLSKMTEGYTSSDISYMVKETARKSFEASIKNENNSVVKISQKMLEEVICQTTPSVSQNEMRHYEKMRDEFIRKNGSERRHIGFLA